MMILSFERHQNTDCSLSGGARFGQDQELAGPAVSVVIPCFNAIRTVASSLRSVLEQSYRDFEVLVVDDGSTDRSLEVIKSLAADDFRVRVISQQNSGPSVARNRGVMAARGTYIAFLDSDDLWTPGHLARAVDLLGSDPSLSLVFAAAGFINETGQLTGNGTQNSRKTLQPLDLLLGNPATTCSTIVARRTVFEVAGLMRPEMRFAEDQEWLFRVVCAGQRVAGSGERSVAYRIADGSLSSETEKMLAGWRTFMTHARAIEPDLVDRHRATAKCHVALYCARHALRTRQPAKVAAQHVIAALVASPIATLRAIACRLARRGFVINPIAN